MLYWVNRVCDFFVVWKLFLKLKEVLSSWLELRYLIVVLWMLLKLK